MSGRLTVAADYFYRGKPGALVTQPDLGNFSMCGLAFIHSAQSGVFKTLFGASTRFTTGRYLFFGQRDVNAQFGVDAGSSNSNFAVHPPIATWFQWAITGNIVGNEVRVYWKLIADVAWNTVACLWPGTSFVPVQFTLGSDEWVPPQTDYSFANVRIWSGAQLTDAELLAEVNSAALVRAANIFAWWKMKPGALLNDASGQGHPLLANGAPVDGADSPLEAPGDEVFAAGSATLPALTSAGAAESASSAAGVATLPALTGAGTGVETPLGVVAAGAATLPALVGQGYAVAHISSGPVQIAGTLAMNPQLSGLVRAASVLSGRLAVVQE